LFRCQAVDLNDLKERRELNADVDPRTEWRTRDDRPGELVANNQASLPPCPLIGHIGRAEQWKTATNLFFPTHGWSCEVDIT